GLDRRKNYAEENPAFLRWFVKAVIKGARNMLTSPEQAIASVKKRDGLLKDEIELVRMKLMNEMALLTPHVRQNGMSSVDRERFVQSVGLVESASVDPVPSHLPVIYTATFLPPNT